MAHVGTAIWDHDDFAQICGSFQSLNTISNHFHCSFVFGQFRSLLSWGRSIRPTDVAMDHIDTKQRSSRHARFWKFSSPEIHYIVCSVCSIPLCIMYSCVKLTADRKVKGTTKLQPHMISCASQSRFHNKYRRIHLILPRSSKIAGLMCRFDGFTGLTWAYMGLVYSLASCSIVTVQWSDKLIVLRSSFLDIFWAIL